jgi:hypothetical protein
VKNPFRFGAALSWCAIRATDTRLSAHDGHPALQVEVEARIRRWHPLFWLFVVRELFRSVRIVRNS